GRLGRWMLRRPVLAGTLLALAVFYANHLLLLMLNAPGEGGAFHYGVTGLMLLWAAGAAVFQWLVAHTGRQAAVFCWAAMDVLFFSAFLWLKDGPSSSLLVGYLLLIALAALRFQTALV